MNEIETFRQNIEQFIASEGISATKFGRKFANDPLFVFQIREGREPRVKTRLRVLENMEKESRAA
ncbi:hypothetical protein [Pseudochrobactrum lubricantis]|uniref:hypothetical protein n=1 Tax=Pseudochrobactrum lubricantis TaxID=558172 RepID=UPI0035E1E0A3